MSSLEIRELRAFDLVYLATPYTKYPHGLNAAFHEAARLAAYLVDEKITVYSPIAHTHPIALYGELDPTAEYWYTFNHNIMHKCEAIVVGQMVGWDTSTGVTYERGWFAGQRKPPYYLDPFTKILSQVPRSAAL